MPVYVLQCIFHGFWVCGYAWLGLLFQRYHESEKYIFIAGYPIGKFKAAMLFSDLLVDFMGEESGTRTNDHSGQHITRIMHAQSHSGISYCPCPKISWHGNVPFLES